MTVSFQVQILSPSPSMQSWLFHKPCLFKLHFDENSIAYPCFTILCCSIFAQNTSLDSVSVYAEEDHEDGPIFLVYTKEIGLNMTPLISKFVPFNFVETKLSTVGFKYKKNFSERH